jgi:hypothetical protein
MSSSSSRIARLKYVSNKNYNRVNTTTKFKKTFGNLMAYGMRSNNYYNQNKKKECCEKAEITPVEIIEEDTCGNVILQISPATDIEKKRNPNISSSLGLFVPTYKDITKSEKNEYWIPSKNFTLIHNLMFKTSMIDVKIIDYNKDYVALPPGQIGWDDSLMNIAPGFLYNYVILSGGNMQIPVNKYIPLVYLNTSEGDDFKLTNTGPIRNNKTSNSEYNTMVRLLKNKTITDDEVSFNREDLSGTSLDII